MDVAQGLRYRSLPFKDLSFLTAWEWLDLRKLVKVPFRVKENANFNTSTISICYLSSMESSLLLILFSIKLRRPSECLDVFCLKNWKIWMMRSANFMMSLRYRGLAVCVEECFWMIASTDELY